MSSSDEPATPPDAALAALWLSELWQPVREYHPGRPPFRRRRHPPGDAPAPDATRAERRA